MSPLRHWHPVALSRDLRNRPLAVQLAGARIALFRPQPGAVAAVDEVCPHRRMRLSLGKVCEGRLQCPYHGWTFDADGAGESPGTPKLTTTTTAYETREVEGLVWVRRKGSETAFPTLDAQQLGFQPMVTMRHEMDAPLDVVLDNFNELEHTATTHLVVGFSLEDMSQVVVDIEPAADHVKIHYHGPCRDYPWVFRKWLGIRRRAVFHVDGQTRYSPVYTYGDYHWVDQHTGRRSWVTVRNVHLFAPVDDHRTTVFTLGYMRLDRPRWNFLLPIVGSFMRRSYRQEVDEDKRMIDNLADKQTDLAGLKLSRFDRVLGANRERVERLYRGRAESAQCAVEGDHANADAR